MKYLDKARLAKARRAKKCRERLRHEREKKQNQKASEKLAKKTYHLSEADKKRELAALARKKLERIKANSVWDALSTCRKAELKQFRRWMDNEKRKPNMGGLTQQGAKDLVEWSGSGDPAKPPWDLYSKGRVMEDSAQDMLNRFLVEKRDNARSQGVVIEKSNGEDDDAVRDWWPWIDGRGKCTKRRMIGEDGEERTVRGRTRIIPKAVYNKDEDEEGEEGEDEEEDEDEDDDEMEEDSDDDEEMGGVVPLEIGGYRLQ
ncbi:MAG: hypothetical protein Q9183_002929 [Haloplaca sp. 2 TL-2023]